MRLEGSWAACGLSLRGESTQFLEAGWRNYSGGRGKTQVCEATGRGAGPHRTFFVTVVALTFLTLTVKANIAGFEPTRVLRELFWGLC